MIRLLCNYVHFQLHLHSNLQWESIHGIYAQLELILVIQQADANPYQILENPASTVLETPIEIMGRWRLWTLANLYLRFFDRKKAVKIRLNVLENSRKCEKVFSK